MDGSLPATLDLDSKKILKAQKVRVRNDPAFLSVVY
jgi:hypothetical protein